MRQDRNGPDSLEAKDRLSDAGGLMFESHWVGYPGESIPSLWRDAHPATEGLYPSERNAGHSIRI